MAKRQAEKDSVMGRGNGPSKPDQAAPQSGGASCPSAQCRPQEDGGVQADHLQPSRLPVKALTQPLPPNPEFSYKNHYFI